MSGKPKDIPMGSEVTMNPETKRLVDLAEAVSKTLPSGRWIEVQEDERRTTCGYRLAWRVFLHGKRHDTGGCPWADPYAVQVTHEPQWAWGTEEGIEYARKLVMGI